MAYIALYRKWRPTIFDEIVGQKNIVKVLKSQIENQRIAHAYLFSGGRGTGKTSTAKILARAVNCLKPINGNPCNECEICTGIISGNIMDVMEIDAASNNSVDDIRLIRDEVFYTPSVSKYRVYIIDEVHMLSIGAFNALLKILEEPPKHVVFILATTESHKLPATILSRCQRFEFKQISIDDMTQRLKLIADESNSEIDQDALELIAAAADGALRDAISILDQCIEENGRITKEIITNIIGLPQEQVLSDMTEAIAQRDYLKCINTVEGITANGRDIAQFVAMLVRFFRDLLVYKATSQKDGIYLTHADKELLDRLSKQFNQERLLGIIKSLSEMEANLRWASMPRVMVEVEMLRLCNDSFNTHSDLNEERLAKLEKMVSGGIVVKQQERITENKQIKKEPIATNTEKMQSRESATKIEEGNTEYFKQWEEVISQLKKNGKMVLYANLVGTKAMMIDDKTLGIAFPDNASQFGKTIVLKNDNQAIIKETIKRLTGADINVKCIGENSKVGENKKVVQKEKVEELAEKFNLPISVIEE